VTTHCPRCGYNWHDQAATYCGGCGGERITLIHTHGKHGHRTPPELGQTEGIKT
jgi:hypothetical protein